MTNISNMSGKLKLDSIIGKKLIEIDNSLAQIVSPNGFRYFLEADLDYDQPDLTFSYGLIDSDEYDRNLIRKISFENKTSFCNWLNSEFFKAEIKIIIQWHNYCLSETAKKIEDIF